MLNKISFIGNIIDRIRLPFRKDKELYSSLYDIIGFYPHNISHYKMALMHKSVMHRNAKGKAVNNERLEFLGDAILDAAVADIVYNHFPGKREGFLTNTRSKLVQRETLNKLANELGLCNLILSNGQPSSHNSYMAGNAFEALVGAIYLDRGYDACVFFLKKRILAQMINIDKVAYKEMNFKSKLIEWSQKNKVQLSFEKVEEKKDEHGSPVFIYQVMLETLAGCIGEGFSKKESQQKASKETYHKLRREPLFVDEVFAAKAERLRLNSEADSSEQSDEETPEDTQESLPGKELVAEAQTAEPEELPTDSVAPAEESGETTQGLDSKDFEDSDDELLKTDKDAEDIIALAEEAAFKEETDEQHTQY